MERAKSHYPILDSGIFVYVAEFNNTETTMIEGKNILVTGFARTGQAVAGFLQNRNCKVIVSESRAEKEFGNYEERFPKVKFEFGGHKTETFLQADLIIISPGIPDTIEPIAEAKKKGIRVISEIELAYHFLKGTLIGITGTNGKSTTVELTGAMIRAGGKNAIVCGNIGTPLIQYCENSKPEDYYVVEISSFQLETIYDFRPHIAAIINLAEDHLDRYPSVKPYYEAKMRIFENQKQNDFAVVNYDDPYLRDHMQNVQSNLFWFSRKEKPPAGIYSEDGLIKTISGGSVVNFSLGNLKGVHNLENTLCAASISLLCGVLPKPMQRAIESFEGLHHRMQFVAEVGGVHYYDDSKATNVDAVVKSLESFPGNIFLIMGGRDKGCDYRVLDPLVRERVKKLLLIGEAKDRIAKELGQSKEFQFYDSLEDAVTNAANLAVPEDVVLLSPACSSFDMFANYEERGKAFVNSVVGLSHGKKN
jgi:UDP-N-acetylmuramoylalanine--D-glutamate ligase